MAIAIRCPHCGKSYNLRDEMAGKRVTCSNPNCKKAFAVERAATTPAAATAPASPAVKAAPNSNHNVDDMAVAALFDEHKVETAAKEPEAAPIRVKCKFCDHENVFDSRMAGKNAPCQNEDCRKIIKVPLPTKEDAKDWRTVKARPTMARTDTEQLEGAWGNAQAGAVSREAIVEAEANQVDEREPRSWGQLIKIGLIAAAFLLILAVGVLWMMRKRSQGKQDQALQTALQYVSPDPKVKVEKLKNPAAGLLHLLAGQYELRHNRAKEARDHLVAARSGVEQPGNNTYERCAALIEVAAAQAELAGDKKAVDQGARLDWDKDKVNAEVRSTLAKLPATAGDELRDMRARALRRLTRTLAAGGNSSSVVSLANAVVPPEERSELLAVIGLELLAMGQRDEADKVASQASVGQVANASSLIALWLALGAPDAPDAKRKHAAEQANAIAPPPGKDGNLTLAARVGYSEGWARQGRIDEARTLAWSAGKPEERLRAGAAVAVAVAQVRPGETADLERCAKVVAAELKGKSVSAWILLELAELSARAGKSDLAAGFAAQIADAGLRAWAQYEILRARLGGMAGQTAPVDLAKEMGPDRLALWLAYAEVARHNAATAGGGVKDVKTWEPEAARPFGFAGVALAER